MKSNYKNQYLLSTKEQTATMNPKNLSLTKIYRKLHKPNHNNSKLEWIEIKMPINPNNSSYQIIITIKYKVNNHPRLLRYNKTISLTEII